MNKNRKLIGIVILFISIGIVFYFSSDKGTYSNSETYTREELQSMVVSTALSYYYNQDYSDYEQYSMDDRQGEPYNNTSFFWRNLNNSPEMVSRSNIYNIDCSTFALLTYLYSIGYDMSEYYEMYEYTFFDDNEWKKSTTSVENYQKSYLLYSKGWHTAFLSTVGNNVSGNDENTGIEYINSSNDNDTSIVYYYRVGLDSDGNYVATEEEQQTIRENILNTLKPGDILVYRRKDKESGSITGHAILYVGDILNDGEDGFIHSTGTDFDSSITPITIGEDDYSVRYDTWDNNFSKNIFIDSETKSSYEFTIIRPINTYCEGDSCIVDNDTVQSIKYKENFSLNLENTVTRDELSRLRIEQYQSEGSSSLNKYNSVNSGDNITYNLVLTNKSKFEYCEAGSPSYKTKEDCTSNGYEWKETTQSSVTYENLTIVGEIPEGATYVDCTSECVYDEDMKTVTWKVSSLTENETKEYTYTVKVSGDDNIVNNGMKITTDSNNNLQLGELTTLVNPTMNNTANQTLIKNEVVKFEKLVDDGKITYNWDSSSDVYKMDLDSVDSAIMSKVDFIKSIYYNSLGIDLVDLSYSNIKAALFDNYTGDSYNVFTKKTDLEVAGLTNEAYININKMLVPGMYGGRLLKGDDNLDRARFLKTSSLEFGDIVITYDFDKQLINLYMFYGYDSSGNTVMVEYYKNTDEEYDLVFYDGTTSAGKSGWRVFKEIFAKDLFVVLRPTQLYGTTVIYNYNDDVTGSKISVEYDIYRSLEIPSRDGYTFSGWYSDNDFNNKVSDGSQLISTKTHTLYAKWIKNTSEISFSSDIDIDDDNKIIKGITLGMSSEMLKEEIVSTGVVTITDIDGNIIADSDYLGTGYKLKIVTDTNEYVYTLSVLGDLTGDGMVKINDVSKLYRYLKGRIDMDKEYVYAGDIISNSEIKINDISRLYRYLKGRVTSLEVE